MGETGQLKMSLTTSERVTLIKEISDRMKNDDWSVVDMTLTQFNLPTENTWSGSTGAYVITMIQRAPDSVLIELAKLVGFELAGLPQAAAPAQYRPLRVFISHLAAQKIYASALQKALLAYGIDSFVAHEDIDPTEEWQKVIESELRTCDALVALLHPNFHKSSWTDQEIGFVMGRDAPAFAVRLGEDPYGFIGRFQAFQGMNKPQELLASELFDAYRKHPKTKLQIREFLFQRFESSGSFAQAKANLKYLEELDAWEADYHTRILKALKNNDQISGAWGVKDRVQALARKWDPDPLPF